MITPITGGLGRENVAKINQVIEVVNQLSKLTGGPGIMVNKCAAGYSLYLDYPLLIRRIRFHRPTAAAAGVDIKIFEVQSAATGDGVYNCYEQKLDATEWTGTGGTDKFVNAEETPTEIEVFNLEESDVESAYSPALALYDLIEAYQIKDDEDNSRWVGKPMVATPRRARTTEAAGAVKNITCNLILRNGVEAAVDELGYNIEVYADICNEGTELNAAAVRLFDDDYVWVVNRQGKWYFAYNFENDISCICNT